MVAEVMARFLYFFLALILVGTGLGVAFYFSQQESPVTAMAWQRFESPEEFAGAVSSQLKNILDSSPVLLLGVLPEDAQGLRFVEAFLESLRGSPSEYQVVVVEPGLGPEGFYSDAVSVSLVNESGRLVEGLRNAQGQELRTVVIAPAEAASQLGEDSPARRLAVSLQRPVMSLIISPLPSRREEEKSFPLHCRTESQDRSGLGSLGCVVIQQARSHYRDRKDPSRYEGRLDQIGEHDYLALLQAPLLKAPPVEGAAPLNNLTK